MNNAVMFKQIFDLYASELWAMSEKDFLAWLNAERDVPDTNVGDLISRQAAIETVHSTIFDSFDICDDESPMTESDKRLLELNKAITTALRRQPTIDPVNHGKWIPNSPFTGNCSECCSSGNLKDNYCSTCGARMADAVSP